MLVGLDFPARCFLANRLDAQANLLLFLIHLDDLEVKLQVRLQMNRLPVVIDGFGVVAQTFDALGDFDERPEIGHTQNLAMHDVAHAVLHFTTFNDFEKQLCDYLEPAQAR